MVTSATINSRIRKRGLNLSSDIICGLNYKVMLFPVIYIALQLFDKTDVSNSRYLS
jgi:hypothetical protein